MGWRHGQQWVNVGGRRYVERVLAGYRYRAYPTPGQAMLLARTFGCARVVFNDALRARRDAHAAGERVSDTQVQARVVTLAKTTPQRQWLGEVASVALVQACQDARRGYRNWFDSLSGTRKGRKVGHPRFRSRKDNRASIRLTRNGFGVTTARGAGGEGRGCSAGVVACPALPSSVTVIREADGAVLRVVCGRGGRHTTTPQRQRCRDRSWPHESRRLVYW